MGAEKQPAEAAAADESRDTPAGAGEFSPEVMTGVFAKFGKKPPTAKPANESEAAAGGEEGGEAKSETDKGDGAEAGADGAAADEQQAGGEEGGEKAEGTDKGDGDGAAAEAGADGKEAGGTEDLPDPQAEKLNQETAKLLKTKLKDLPDDVRTTVQSFMDERTAQITGKAKSENDRLGTRVTELTSELETLRDKGVVPVVIAGVHPALLADSAEQIDQEVEQMEEFEDWAERFRDGFNLPDADNHDPKQPSYTADQIRQQLRTVQREKDRVIPAARAKLTDRQKTDEKIKAAMPALFDPRSAEYARAQALLKAQPYLRSRADQNVIIAQQILGERALQQLQQRQAPGKKPGNSAPNAAGKKPVAGAAPIKRAPRAPGDGAPAHGSPLDREDQRPAASAAVKQFTKTRTKTDLRSAVGALLFR